MDAVPVIVTGQEPEWLRKQFHQLMPVGALETEFVFEDRCPAGVGSCVVVTGRPPRFAYVLDPTFPPGLAVALRPILNRAGVKPT